MECCSCGNPARHRLGALDLCNECAKQVLDHESQTERALNNIDTVLQGGPCLVPDPNAPKAMPRGDRNGLVRQMYKHGHLIRVTYHDAIPGGKYVKAHYRVTIGLNARYGNTSDNPDYRQWTCRRTFTDVTTALVYGRRIARGASKGAAND